MRLKAIVVALALLVATLSLSTPAAATSNDHWEQRIHEIINLKRNNHNLRSLRSGPCPDRTAERWARKLDRTNSWYHQDMSNVLEKCNAKMAGEVLAYGYATPRGTVRGWLKSPSHRAVILRGRYDRIGVSVRWLSSGTRLAVVNVIDK